MTIKLQTYDNYKPSGVEWLGEIPEHWEVKRFKFVSNIQKGKLPRKIVSTNELNLPPYMSMEYLRGGEENQWVLDKDAKIIDKEKTLLLWDGSNAGEFIKSRKGVISSTVAEIEFKDIHNNYAWFYSKFLEIELRKKTIGMGIPHVNGTELKNFSIAIPPIKEQTTIAHFLDDKTAKIDQAIAIKQKQIELLKERRQILIHKAVTRGLNDKVKLKDSGVEWIGEIPEGWKLSPLRHLGKTQNGISKGGESFGTGFPFVSYGDVYKDIKLPELVNGLVESTIEDRKQYSVLEGDILFTRTSETVEEIGFSSTCLQTIENATFAGFLIRFRPQKNKLHKEFSKYYFSSSTHRAFFVKEMNLVIRASLSQDLLKRMPVLLPPLSEQEEIGNYLNNATSKIATAISLKEQEIEQLKEYKMSLIDGVVTGKVRVC